MKKTILLSLICLFLISGCSLFPVKQIACTLEAKLCPDGSAVGRTGPNCEFAACPVSDFQTCAAAGNPVMESYPRQCSFEGKNFVEKLPDLEVVGQSCQKNEDCPLPVSYAVMSSCPYASKCYQNKCVVVCPMWQQSANVKCQQKSECDCAQWIGTRNFSCECLDNQCLAIVAK